MFVRRKLAAICAVPLLLVAACDEAEPTPKMPSPTASSSTPTETPTVDPLAIPEVAKEPTKEGAEALVRHYFDMFNYFLESGDAVPIRKLYIPSCTYCEAAVQVYGFAQSKGHTFTGAKSILKVRTFPLSERSVLALVTSKQTAIIETDKQGRQLSRVPPVERDRYEYFVRLEDGQWKINTVDDAK